MAAETRATARRWARRLTPALLATALVAVAAPVAAASPSPSPEGEAPAAPAGHTANGGVFFDDFSYFSSSDPRIAARKWTVRTTPGGPGVQGASWPKRNVTFPHSSGSKVMQLKSRTDGTNAGTEHAEMVHQRKFFEGTYAARVRFSDAPVSGADGDEVVQTFFTITPLAQDNDPDYGELDFEYLPNGGWTTPGPIMHLTSWETYQLEPWDADNVSTTVSASHAGWRTLVIHVSGGVIRYYIDGAQVAEHSGKFYPETPMSINFNQWFIKPGEPGRKRTWLQQVDWVYHSKNEVVAPADVSARVNSYRASRTTFTDTVPNP
ncbi:glycoside hydrolase family 16 protein [Sinosporangium siamense]|uniref:GH16 domain-containing protein n=1 Tax=Sinosporangium siamense TaxID=1367973 RepID=A0A919R9H7_9ACTN|nr:glycoside hydrolase family 16 protein [Sinosporangium siamense]GII89818.1 hypothetical protein Ssi02_00490 [Sinosporangium siamense]